MAQKIRLAVIGNRPMYMRLGLCFLIFSISFVAGCRPASSAGHTAGNEVSSMDYKAHGNQDLEISNNELPKLEDDALSGSAEAAHRLSLFYDMIKLDSKKATYWASIEAENGSPSGQYNYGFHLYKDPDPKVRLRAKYWLKLAAKNGEPLAVSLLKEMDIESKESKGSEIQ